MLAMHGDFMEEGVRATQDAKAEAIASDGQGSTVCQGCREHSLTMYVEVGSCRCCMEHSSAMVKDGRSLIFPTGRRE